jgi:hypothetical protein
MSYNGWHNRATWCVHLWLTNDEWTYDTLREFIAARRDAGQPIDAEAIEWFARGVLTPKARADIGSLRTVNWEEIAEAVQEVAI